MTAAAPKTPNASENTVKTLALTTASPKGKATLGASKATPTGGPI